MNTYAFERANGILHGLHPFEAGDLAVLVVESHAILAVASVERLALTAILGVQRATPAANKLEGVRSPRLRPPAC